MPPAPLYFLLQFLNYKQANYEICYENICLLHANFFVRENYNVGVRAGDMHVAAWSRLTRCYIKTSPWLTCDFELSNMPL